MHIKRSRGESQTEMTLLSVSKSTASTEARKTTIVKSFEDVVESYGYGENVDLLVREVGVPTSSDGIILEIANVFQLNEQMMSTFRYVLESGGVEKFNHKINFEDNTITFTVYFMDLEEGKKSEGYIKGWKYFTHPLLYVGLLCIWNPQRYLFFLP